MIDYCTISRSNQFKVKKLLWKTGNIRDALNDLGKDSTTKE